MPFGSLLYYFGVTALTGAGKCDHFQSGLLSLMALYLLSYDITAKNDDYESLWTWLNGLKAKRVLYSQFLVPWTPTGPEPALDLVNQALTHLLQGDRLFCCEIFSNGVGTMAWTTNLLIKEEAFLDLLSSHARRLS